MPLEVTCGHCQGDIVVESLGVTVACPLCGSHLEVPDPEAAIEMPQGTPSTILSAAAATAAVVEEHAAAPPVVAPNPVDEPAWQPPPPVAPGTPLEPASTAAEFTLSEDAPVSDPDALSEAPTSILSQSDLNAASNRASASSTASESPIAAFTAPARESADEPDRATEPAATAGGPATVSWSWFIIVASYASAVTLFLLYLLLTSGIRRQHALESLPDLVPEMHGGQVGMKVPKPQENVAPGHVLRLGQSQRFGSVQVSPVRITRGPIHFENAFKPEESTREPSAPVLKLWLKFENVSADQTFPTLDRTLVFKRIFQKKPEHVFTNNFLCAANQRRFDGRLFYMFEVPEFSEFLITGQELGHAVKPGEAWESFVPSQEGVADLTGNCVWRVQFRKGYNPQSHRGVTTLIDVQFRAEEIQDEA